MDSPRPIFWWGLGGASLLALIALSLNNKDAIVATITTVGGSIRDAAFKASLPERSQPYGQMLVDAGSEYDVSPFLLWALMERESGSGTQLKPSGPAGTGDFAPRGSSNRMPPDGLGFGRGLMQLDFDGDEIKKGLDWRDPKGNIRAGARVLVGALKFFAMTHGTKGMSIRWAKDGESYQIGGPNADYEDPRPLAGDALTAAALAAYNTGQGNVLVSVAQGLSPDVTTTPGPSKKPDYSADVLKRASGLLARYDSTPDPGAGPPIDISTIPDLPLPDVGNAS